MELKNIIFHTLTTEQHSSNVDVEERPEELSLPNPNADKLVSEARESYNKESSIAYARFAHGWFPDCLTQLVSEEESFFSFSKKGLGNLKRKLEEQPLTSGGYLFFIRYTENDNDFMLALLLKNIDGFVIDEHELSESHILNLDKLHFGARVNVNKWQNDDSTYITFLKGSGRAEVTTYFKDFLCIDHDSFNDPKDNTQKLVNAVSDYCNENVENESDRYNIRDRIARELTSKADNKESISVESIASLINPDDSQHFVSYINSNEYEIQPDFKIYKSAIKQLIRYRGRTRNLSISFEQSALQEGLVGLDWEGEGVDKKRVLIVRDVPPNLIKDLGAENIHNTDE